MTAGNGDRGMLTFFACGSAAAGKSTLIGRLLTDAKLIPDDRLEDLSSSSESAGSVREGIDFAKLVDGLEEQRERGPAIDVTYSVFSTPGRKFMVADAPEDEHHIRNMAMGALSAQAAVVVIDAPRGIVTQTRRHTFIAGMMGVRSAILAVNKMDLVGFDESVFEAIAAQYRSFAAETGIESVLAIPVAARAGENVTRHSPEMPWYEGPTLLEALETLEIPPPAVAKGFRLPVERISPPDQGFTGYQGTVAAGTIRRGDAVTVYPVARASRIDRIVTDHGDAPEARVGDAVTLVLADDIDVGRGDVISAGAEPDVTDQFAAKLIWMDARPLIPERRYILKLGTAEVGAAVTELKYHFNVDSLEHMAAKILEMNEVAFCNFALDRPIAAEPFADDPSLGAFILTDRRTNDIVGAGTIAFSLRRATNVRWQEMEIGKAESSALNAQKPAIIWLTGLPGAGKSTIANLVQKRLHAMGRHTYLLDGDNLRHGINKDLGFVEADRVENIRRVAEIAKLFVDSGTIVLVSLISPYRSERLMARELVEEEEFIEVFVDTPLTVCEERDPKGLYRKARAGTLINFTGVDAPYEVPLDPEITVDGSTDSGEAAANLIVEYLLGRGHIGRS